MKKSTLHFILLLTGLLFAGSVSNAQIGSGLWSFSNPRPFGFVSYQVSYSGDNNGIIVGDAGGIAKTTDGGGTWTYFAYTFLNVSGDVTKPTFNDVQFVNPSLAYAVGNNGAMIKSIDGGTNWTFVNTPYFNTGSEINTVFFTNATTGYIGGDGDLVSRKYIIYKTTDGGASWAIDHEFAGPPEDWQNPTIYKIRFSSTGTAYVGGEAGFIYKYSNGTWTNYSVTPATVFPNVRANDTFIYQHTWDQFLDTIYSTYNDNVNGLNQQNYRAIAIINDTAVVAGTQNNGGLVRINTAGPSGIYSMINNGSALAQVYAPSGSNQFYNLICRDGVIVAGTSSDGKMLLSVDGGMNFTLKTVYPAGSKEEGIGFFGIDITPSKRFALCGEAGIIADSLAQWRLPYATVKQSRGFSGYGMESIEFCDADNGIAAGTGGTMFRTMNGGTNWEDISNASFSEQDYYTSVKYLSPLVLYAAASNGLLFKSIDKGASFDLLFPEPDNGNLAAIDFINEDTGWMAVNIMYTDTVDYSNTFHSKMYRTADGGNTWDSSATVFPVTGYDDAYSIFYDLKFFNASIGYASASKGGIFKTTDGGIHWVKQTNVPAFASDKNINSISIADANIVYASGDQGLVMKTINGGNSWTMCNAGLPTLYSNYKKILMYDAGQGMAFGNGAVFTTKDGGASWSPYYAPINDGFAAACFAPVNGCTTGICKKIFAGGFFRGNIMKFDADVVLPVKFSNLTGTGTSQGNQLFWTAFLQETVNYFEVERSPDGKKFAKTGDAVIPGSMAYQSYKWLDETPLTGKNYYRIKAVENTGAIYYTNIVVITSKSAAKWNHQLSNGNLLLTNAKALTGNINVRILSSTGQLMAAKNWKQSGGAFNGFITLPSSAKGIYFVKVDNEGTEYNCNILIQ
ncbi:MAG: YCF48-related protein [Ferruginibacter sp.]